MAIAPVNNSQPGLINALPEELMVKIFTEFTSLELTDKIMLVCRTWNRLASDSSLWRSKLQELNCNVIDEAVWKQHAPGIVKAEGISFEGLQPLDYRLAFFEVARFYARLKAAGTSIERDKGVTILTIPSELSINLVHAEFGNRLPFFLGRILNEDLRVVKTDQAYRIIITKNVLTGSKGKSNDDQRVLAESAGCSLPKAVEAMVLALLTEKSESVRLFVNNPWTFTRCVEVIGGWPWVVGGYGPAGLHVLNSPAFPMVTYGAAGVRKF